MARVQAQETATIAAPPMQVYGVLADYRNHHLHILPKQYFRDFVVEEGGYGAGTIFRATVQVFGSKTMNQMAVTEPAPGRVLVETDLATGLVTSFTVTPTADGQQSQVQITTTWERKAGLLGRIEAFATVAVMRMIYRKELAQLATYVQQPNAVQPK